MMTVQQQQQRRLCIFLQAIGLLGASSRMSDVALSWHLAGRSGHPCPNHQIHRFTASRKDGQSSPICLRCGAQRPARSQAFLIVQQVRWQLIARALPSRATPRAFAGLA